MWSKVKEGARTTLTSEILTQNSWIPLAKFAASDAGLFMQNLILSAHAKGLGTCPQGSVAIWEDAVREEFEISKQYSLLCGICVGYPSEGKVNSFEAHRLLPSEISAPIKD